MRYRQSKKSYRTAVGCHHSGEQTGEQQQQVTHVLDFHPEVRGIALTHEQRIERLGKQQRHDDGYDGQTSKQRHRVHRDTTKATHPPHREDLHTLL